MVIGFYVLLWAMVGVFLTAIFIVGHAGRPIVMEYDKNWRLQIEEPVAESNSDPSALSFSLVWITKSNTIFSQPFPTLISKRPHRS